MKPKPPPDHESPALLLATLYSARKSGDRVLERLTRCRLAALGIVISFGDELPPPAKTKVGRHVRESRRRGVEPRQFSE